MSEKKRILVCGGAGFIGSNFANFHKNDYDVIALDNLFLGDPRNLDEGVNFIEGDACKTEDLDKVGSVDYILNLAGTSSQPMFNGDGLVSGYVNSVESFMRVLEWGQKNDVKKVLYASTSSLYANNPLPLIETQEVIPPNHYAVTKMLYEGASRCFNAVHPEMEIIGFRFMSIYGPNEEAKGEFANLISQFVWDIARGLRPMIYGDGSQTRDFTNVLDVVQAVTLAMESKSHLGANVFNIGTGNSVSLNEITDAIYKAFGKENDAEHIENPIKESYIQDQYADITKIQDALNFAPGVKLEDGIKQQVENLRIERIRHSSSDLMRGMK
ncbi:MAG: NAD-dependent epimerase/dehydratase family protein [Gammaproteobacteria bacterium]|nr:NAD-dependent epimerase/dehydratase family protein [Gammaproteobacteria bacterium]